MTDSCVQVFGPIVLSDPAHIYQDWTTLEQNTHFKAFFSGFDSIMAAARAAKYDEVILGLTSMLGLFRN